MLARSPKQAGLYMSLGQVYMAKHDYADAITVLKQAKELSPKDGRPDTLIATALLNSGRPAEMKTHFEHAMELQPDNPAVMNNMAFYLAENGGNLDEAQRLAQQAVQKAPGEANFSDTLGWVYVKKNMHGAAAQIFRNLVEKQPQQPHPALSSPALHSKWARETAAAQPLRATSRAIPFAGKRRRAENQNSAGCAQLAHAFRHCRTTPRRRFHLRLLV